MQTFVVVALFLLAAPVAWSGEFVASEADFRCLTEGVQPDGMHFYVGHAKRRLLKRAVAKTNRRKLGKGYPKGTILQLFPFEAMVKRGGRFNPDGGGWEYFKLAITEQGTTQIVQRGGAEVANGLGSCQGCHLRLAAEHDSVCEFVVGATGLGLTNEQIAALQATDGRCAPPTPAADR